MSPLNRGPLLGPRMPPIGMRPPLPRFGGRPPMPGMPPRMPPPIGPMFGPMRPRMPPRPGPMMRPLGPPPLFGPRGRGVPPLMPPMGGPRVMGPRGPLMRPGPRGLLPPQVLPHMRPRFPVGNGGVKIKAAMNAKKISKLEEAEMKKPWMTDEIRNEIQKKNKLYAKAKKNKDAKEWEEFKDLRNKVTRMIRDAKNEYLAKNSEQAHIYEDEDDEPYDKRDENYTSTEDDDERSHYCEICDREFETMELHRRHNESHKICGIDGCTFSAHPKLVEKHIGMQHYTGLYHRMKNLSTPEDIDKWIVERKKKYPTKNNVERKRAEQSEKRERGEIIEKQKNTRDSRRPVARERKRNTRKRKTREVKVEPEPTTQLYRGLLPFAGTANLPRITSENDDRESEIVEKIENIEFLTITCNISDDEDEPDPLRSGKVSFQSPEVPSNLPKVPLDSPVACPKIVNHSGLASLIANYGSDSEDDEAPDEIPIKRIKTEIPRENETSHAPEQLFVESGQDQRTNVPKVECDSRKDRCTRRERKKPLPKKQSRCPPVVDDSQKNRKSFMLLRRLLSRSIQHERNLICQCIKHIADNNFFLE